MSDCDEDAADRPHPAAPSPFARPLADHWTWNRKSRSCDAHCQDGDKTVLFHPAWSCGTSAIRGTKVLNNTRSYWEIGLAGGLGGTSLMFGVGTRASRLGTSGFTDLIGEDRSSWGLSHKGLLWHAGRRQKYCRPFRETREARVGLLFDGVYGTLTYFKDGVCLGVAFRDLDKVAEPLYPLVSSTSMRSRMTLERTERELVSLQDLCRAAVLRQLRDDDEEDVAGRIWRLNIPTAIRRYLEEEPGGGAGDDEQRADQCQWYVPRF